jgi:hypothetical protein
MIQSSSLSNPRLYDQYFTPAEPRMIADIPAVHSNLSRTSFFPISRYGKITGKLVHSNHFFKAQSKHQRLDHRSPAGGFELDLNGFSTSTLGIAPLGAFELDSNCSRTAVNKAKIRPPKTLCTFKVEDAECFYRREGC